MRGAVESTGEGIQRMKTTKQEQQLWRELCVEAEVFKERLFRAKLYETAHLMDSVTRKIGWEVAGLLGRTK